MTDRSEWRSYQPRATFTKTAILVDVAGSDAVVTITAPFGAQHLRGPFYIVAVDDRSYGVDRHEFERAHERLDGHRWRKRGVVRARRLAVETTVRTTLDGHAESEVVALPRDWLVEHAGGEITTMNHHEFTQRYEPVDD